MTMEEFEQKLTENTPEELLSMLVECCMMAGKCSVNAARLLMMESCLMSPAKEENRTYDFWVKEQVEQEIRAGRLEEKVREALKAAEARAQAAEDMVRHLTAAMAGEIPEARVVGYEEIAAMPLGTLLWEDYFNGEEGKWTTLAMVFKSDDLTLANSETSTFILPGMGEADVDANRFRWWTAKPTEEQRLLTY